MLQSNGMDPIARRRRMRDCWRRTRNLFRWKRHEKNAGTGETVLAEFLTGDISPKVVAVKPPFVVATDDNPLSPSSPPLLAKEETTFKKQYQDRPPSSNIYALIDSLLTHQNDLRSKISCSVLSTTTPLCVFDDGTVDEKPFLAITKRPRQQEQLPVVTPPQRRRKKPYEQAEL